MLCLRCTDHPVTDVNVNRVRCCTRSRYVVWEAAQAIPRAFVVLPHVSRQDLASAATKEPAHVRAVTYDSSKPEDTPIEVASLAPGLANAETQATSQP